MLFPLLAALVAATLFFGGTTKPNYESIPELPGLLVPQSTGKERQIVSMTKDASMYTERMRRSAIMAVHSCQMDNTCIYSETCNGTVKTCSGGSVSNKIRETRTSIGFTNGAVEAYMLTSICNTKPISHVVPPPPPVTEIYDGGFPYDDFPNIVDGGIPSMDTTLNTLYYDGGGPSSNYVTVFDGVDPLSNIMDIIYSQLDGIPNLDGGNPNTNVC